MSSNAPVPLATMPLDGRPDIVLRRLIAALVIAPAGALAGWFLASALGVGSLAAAGAVVASIGLLASAVWRWRARFELHRDHIAFGRGATLRRASFDEVETVELRLNEPFKGALPDAYARLRVGLRRAIRSWWSARKSRGVALSEHGLRPLADADLAARASRVSAPFRRSVGEAAGWIPWSAIRAVEHRGYDVVLHLHSRTPVADELAARRRSVIALTFLALRPRRARSSRARRWSRRRAFERARRASATGSARTR